MSPTAVPGVAGTVDGVISPGSKSMHVEAFSEIGVTRDDGIGLSPNALRGVLLALELSAPAGFFETGDLPRITVF